MKSLFAFGCVVLLFACGRSARAAASFNADWRPPTGIPTPPFGITTTRHMYADAGYTWDYGSGPQPYRVNAFGPYTHYVDNSHPTATDTNNPFGSEAVPRRTWPYPLSAGAAVQVHGGPYNFSNAQSSTLAFGGAGTAERPIFLYGTTADKALMPQIARSELYAWGNFAVIEQLRFSNDCVVSTRPQLKGAPVLNVAIRTCYFRGTATAGNPTCINSGGSSGNSAQNYTQNLVILGNEMHDYGDWQATTENDAAAFILSQHCIDSWVLDNVAYNFGGDAIRVGADQGDTPSGQNYYVGRNHFYDNRENGVDVKQAVNAVFSENVMHGFAPSSSSNGEAVVIHYDPKNIWFLNNTIYDTRRGIVSTGVSGDHLYLVGNTIYNTTDHALYPDRGGGHVHIYNNTIHGCASGIVSTGVLNSLDIHGNLIHDVTGNYLHVAQSGVRAAATVSHELYYETGGAVAVSWGTTYTSVAAWMAGTTVGDNSLEQPPAFLDAVSHDYRLLAGSPAIGAGFDLTALDATFQSFFGVSLLRDARGVARPTDGAYDIGAFEYTTALAPVITTQPATQTVTAGGSLVFSVSASGTEPFSYQWKRDGVDLAGATSATYALPSAQLFHAATYTVAVTNSVGSITSTGSVLTIDPAPASTARVLNLSTRALALAGSDAMIPGFVISGTGTKRLLLRAVGPTLGGFGVIGALTDPLLTLKVQNPATQVYSDLATNDDWSTATNATEIATTAATLGAFPLAAGSADAVLLLDLPPGQYSATAAGRNATTGVAIFELYDVDASAPAARLINLSNRGYVGTNSDIMIPGFVISAEGSKTLLVRAVGPTLAGFGVTGTLADPQLAIHRRIPNTSNDELILTNDDWDGAPGSAMTASVAQQVSAFPLPAGSNDAAFVVTLAPGLYTVHASGVGTTTGTALVEVYIVP